VWVQWIWNLQIPIKSSAYPLCADAFGGGDFRAFSGLVLNSSRDCNLDTFGRRWNFTHAGTHLFSWTVKPVAQQQQWSLHLNSHVRTTAILDSLPVEVASKQNVIFIVDNYDALQDSEPPSRGLPTWVDVSDKDQELDHDQSWKDVGDEYDGSVTVLCERKVPKNGRL
jgi:hypothetical protein